MNRAVAIIVEAEDSTATKRALGVLGAAEALAAAGLRLILVAPDEVVVRERPRHHWWRRSRTHG